MLDVKKVWNNPEIADLSVIDTKGGPVYTSIEDGPAVYNAEDKKWWIPVGKS